MCAGAVVLSPSRRRCIRHFISIFGSNIVLLRRIIRLLRYAHLKSMAEDLKLMSTEKQLQLAVISKQANKKTKLTTI